MNGGALEKRKREAELEEITSDYWEKPHSTYLESYEAEARVAYINECFRSCIFCCAALLDQEFRHIIVTESKKPGYELKRIAGKCFGHILGIAENHPKLKDFYKDADWVRKARNKIAAHPNYLTSPDFTKDNFKIIYALTCKNYLKSFRGMINYLEKEDLVGLKDLGFDFSTAKEIEKYIRNLLYDLNEKPLNIFSIDDLEKAILQKLALKAYNKTARIMKSL
jgi:hypothetical protein